MFRSICIDEDDFWSGTKTLFWTEIIFVRKCSFEKLLRAFGPGFSYLQQTEGALDEAAVRVHVLAELSLQDGLLLRHQAQSLSRGGQQQLGVRAETRIWTTQTFTEVIHVQKT